MTILLILLILAIIGILFWALWDGKGAEKPRELPGSGAGAGDDVSKQETMRRRASDRAIEDQYPGEEGPGKGRRTSDRGEGESVSEPPDEFELPYPVKDIIPEKSRFRVYERTLLNAEIYAQKGDFATALSLFDGVRNRVNDTEVRHKIDVDMEFLRQLQQRREATAKQRDREAMSKIAGGGAAAAADAGAGKEITLKVDGQLPPTISIGVINPADMIDTDAIVQKVADQLRNDLDGMRGDRDPGSLPAADSAGLGALTKQAVERLRSELGTITTLKEELRKLATHPDKQGASAALETELGHIDDLKNRLDDVINPAEDTRAASTLHRQLGEISSLKDQLDDLPAFMEKLEQIPEIRDALEDAVSHPEGGEALSALRRELSDIAALKERVDPHVPSRSDSGAITALRRELQEMADLHEDLRKKSDDELSAREMDEFKKKVEQAEDLKSALGNLAKEKPELDSLREEMRGLQDQLNELAKKGVPESDRFPGLTQARYEAPIPITLDTKPIMELLDKLPGRPAPVAPAGAASGPGVATGPGAAAAPAAQAGGASTVEKQVESASGEPEDDFELMKEYGKDQYDDRRSDEEIFEKILSEGKPEEEQRDSFEILGDKREHADEYSVSDPTYEKKIREEERFYRSLLSTDKRKRKELPILKVSYDFSRLPDEMSLSKDKNIMEYAFYKYKPMLEKANLFIKKRQVRDAMNYYKVVMSQNIPPEFKAMIRKNINDLTEYLENYLTFE